ncbi:NAD-dependent epimerase/dehydratase family protein [Thermodesulfobacteriota bacterium]
MDTPLTMSRWFITGGCGFIGTSFIKRLVAEGVHFIRVLDNLSVGTRENLSRVCNFTELDSTLRSESSALSPRPSTELSIELVVGDITDYDTCLNCTQGVDIIVHLAAATGVRLSVENPRQDMEANIIGTFNLLEAARQHNVNRFIFASSGAPVGECEPPIHEELAPHPVSPYGASKLAGEAYCSAYFRTFGIQTVALRFGNVYGPGSGHKNSVIAKFIKQAINEAVCEVYGDGNQTRDFIFIDDLIQAIQKAANQPTLTPGSAGHSPFPWGETFQIATSIEHTINEVSNLLKKYLEKEFGISMKIEYGQPRIGDVKRNYSDTSKAKRLLDWQPTISLEDGLKKTIAYFEELIKNGIG